MYLEQPGSGVYARVSRIACSTASTSLSGTRPSAAPEPVATTRLCRGIDAFALGLGSPAAQAYAYA